MPNVEAVAKQSDDDLRRQLAEMKAAKEAAEAQLAEERKKTIARYRMQVSEKGGASLYGLRRFPVTYYKKEWRMLLVDLRDMILTFLEEHDAELTDEKSNGKTNSEGS
jgi:hypothetical protein